MHSGSQGGPMTDQSGPAPARASRSVQQETGRGPQTSVTYGLNSSNLSAQSDLMLLWENKLRERLDMGGSMACKLTWRRKVTPQGRLIYRLAPLTHRISDSAYIGFLPTPCASEERDTSRPKVLAKCDRGGRVARRICSLSLPARMQPDPVSLNPSFAGWMMGYSQEWDDCAPTETPSSRKSRQK
jgi:hypothetical protein